MTTDQELWIPDPAARLTVWRVTWIAFHGMHHGDREDHLHIAAYTPQEALQQAARASGLPRERWGEAQWTVEATTP